MMDAVQRVAAKIRDYSDEKLRSCLTLVEARLGEGVPIPNTAWERRVLLSLMTMYQRERRRRRTT